MGLGEPELVKQEHHMVKSMEVLILSLCCTPRVRVANDGKKLLWCWSLLKVSGSFRLQRRQQSIFPVSYFIQLITS